MRDNLKAAAQPRQTIKLAGLLASFTSTATSR
jgi:hypothetical protein